MSATSDDRRRLTGFGVALGGPYAFLPELARQAESHGFDAVWVSETGQESIVQATVCLTATSRIEVGTNITLAFPRSPTITAMQAWDLDELSGGRFIVGLGSQVKRIIEERFLGRLRPAGEAHGRVRAGDEDRVAHRARRGRHVRR